MPEQLPSCDAAQAALQPVLSAATAAILAGVEHARAYHDWRDRSIDRSLAPALVRYETKLRLLDAGQQVSDEELVEAADDSSQPPLTIAPLPFEPIPLSNNGLLLETDLYRVRILKSDQGALPPPGPSPRRRKFYAQQQELPFFPPIADGAVAAPLTAVPAKVNLVLHWTVDADYRLTKINLALPKGGENTRASVEWEWDEVIWRPAPMFVSVAPAAEAPADELDITLDRGADTGTAHGGNEE